MLGDSRGRDDYRRAIQAYAALVQRFPERVWLRTGLIETLREYATLLAEPIEYQDPQSSISRVVELAGTLDREGWAASPYFDEQVLNRWTGLESKLTSRAPLRPDNARNAVHVARQAVDCDSERPDSWRSLGIACYRAGDCASAAGSMRRAMDLDHGGSAADWFLMAAIDHRLGNTQEARLWYDRANSWLKREGARESEENPQLRRCRDEALRVLGLRVSDSTDEATGVPLIYVPTTPNGVAHFQRRPHPEILH